MLLLEYGAIWWGTKLSDVVFVGHEDAQDSQTIAEVFGTEGSSKDPWHPIVIKQMAPWPTDAACQAATATATPSNAQTNADTMSQEGPLRRAFHRIARVFAPNQSD
ncbi:unnamed protein product [Vitrella brassicaformis CCMP3155]|uniref:Uncharacterized protein n=1 Tax=Vitrella brassicaformis (strain CCMP3155) TaxID=1169540 RepID=A0A0G4G618_VITBC|nr:unnamed protein product [Vitrella brassicaformis CCMP3155]|eukprot:CEM23985.1 unnamed protein product [Vitrella brassicaformis CCMP3155]